MEFEALWCNPTNSASGVTICNMAYIATHWYFSEESVKCGQSKKSGPHITSLTSLRVWRLITSDLHIRMLMPVGHHMA